MIETPHIVALLDSHSQRYEKALAVINGGIAAKQIWNAEFQDAKFALSNGIERALHVIFDRWIAVRPQDWQRAAWQEDFSMYCSFNQAAGRLKRLSKTVTAANTPGATAAIIHEYIKALREIDAIWKGIQSLKPFVVKGRKPSQTRTEEEIAAELVNTGICAICGRRQKMGAADKLVHHGYQMSGYNHTGYRMGKCFGTGYRPYELSNEANLAFAPVLLDIQADIKRTLKELKSGKVTELTVIRDDKNVVLRKGSPEFDRELDYQLSRAESDLRRVRADIKTNQAQIDNWTPQPLKYGR